MCTAVGLIVQILLSSFSTSGNERSLAKRWAGKLMHSVWHFLLFHSQAGRIGKEKLNLESRNWSQYTWNVTMKQRARPSFLRMFWKNSSFLAPLDISFCSHGLQCPPLDWDQCLTTRHTVWILSLKNYSF